MESWQLIFNDVVVFNVVVWLLQISYVKPQQTTNHFEGIEKILWLVKTMTIFLNSEKVWIYTILQYKIVRLPL